MINTDWQNVLFAFGLTLFAGLSTSVGSIFTFFPNKMSNKFLSISLGFSAGVMIYLSFMEILIGAEESLIEIFTAKQGKFIALFAFFGGMFLIHKLSKWVTINPKKLEDSGGSSTDQVSRELMRTGVLSALAIAIHNIPEGIAVSVPIYYATKSKKKAFM